MAPYFHLTRPQWVHRIGTPNLKEYILSAIDEKDVFAKYLMIGVSDIIYCLAHSNNRICNPLRVDKNPSLTFKQYSTKIIMIDYANQYYRGDIFEIVGKIIGKDCNISKDFIDICNDIINTMNITYSNTKDSATPTNVVKKQTTIDVIYRDITSFDKALFRASGLKDSTIIDNIRAVDTYILNDIPMDYRYSQYDPCYCYTVNPNRVKLYFPNRNKGDTKFITNNRCPLENINLITKCESIIITKSIKDRCLITQMLSELNIKDVQVVTFSSESVRVNLDIIEFLRERSDRLYILFDNDAAGLEATQFYKDMYECIPIYFNMIFQGTKDPSDAVKKYKYDRVKQHMYNITIEQQWH